MKMRDIPNLILNYRPGIVVYADAALSHPLCILVAPASKARRSHHAFHGVPQYYREGNELS